MQRCWGISLIALVAMAGVARASGEREALVRLVPDDVSVCFLLGDLRPQGDKFKQAKWFKKIEHTALGKAMADAPELRKFDVVGEQLAKRLELPWPKLRDEVFAGPVVLAYRPGPPQQPEQEAGLLLLHARDAALLSQFVERFHADLKKSGQLKVLDRRVHRGEVYFRRVDRDGEAFLFIKDGILAQSPSESLLLNVLDRRLDAKQAALPLLTQAKRVGAENALAMLWLNPRAFDADLKHQLTKLPAEQAASLRSFLEHWQAVNGICLALNVTEEPELTASIHARFADLPSSAQRVARDAAVVSDLWQRFPEQSVLKVASRADYASLTQTLEAILPPEQRKQFTEALQNPLGLSLGKDMFATLLPLAGPDWGISIASPSESKLFPNVLLALRVRPTPGAPPIIQEKIALTALQLYVNLAVVEHNMKNKDKVTLRSEMQGKVEVKYLVNDKQFPPGFMPAFALKEGYLVLGSSPDALRKFAKSSTAGKKPTEVPLARLSMPELTRLLSERREPIVNFLSARKQVGLPEAARLLDRLIGDLSAFDDLTIGQRLDDDQVAWVMRLKTGK